MENKPITAVIVGGGHRSMIYADYSLSHPEALKIVGIADPNRERREMAAKRYGFSEDACFEDAAALAQLGTEQSGSTGYFYLELEGDRATGLIQPKLVFCQVEQIVLTGGSEAVALLTLFRTSAKLSRTCLQVTICLK